MTYVNVGFMCLGTVVAFILWRFVNNLKPEEYTVWNVGTTLGIVLGGAAMKFFANGDPYALASYFIGLFIGIIVYNIWGVIWRKLVQPALR